MDELRRVPSGVAMVFPPLPRSIYEINLSSALGWGYAARATFSETRLLLNAPAAEETTLRMRMVEIAQNIFVGG